MYINDNFQYKDWNKINSLDDFILLFPAFLMP